MHHVLFMTSCRLFSDIFFVLFLEACSTYSWYFFWILMKLIRLLKKCFFWKCFLNFSFFQMIGIKFSRNCCTFCFMWSSRHFLKLFSCFFWEFFLTLFHVSSEILRSSSDSVPHHVHAKFQTFFKNFSHAIFGSFFNIINEVSSEFSWNCFDF